LRKRKRRRQADAAQPCAKPGRGAGFQTGRIADIHVGSVFEFEPDAGLEARDTADLEICATTKMNALPADA